MKEFEVEIFLSQSLFGVEALTVMEVRSNGREEGVESRCIQLLTPKAMGDCVGGG